MKKLTIVLLALLMLSSVSFAAEATDRFEKVVNRMVKAINDANWPDVQADFGQVMLDAFPLEKSKPFKGAIVTEITPATQFYPAEEYHQKYYVKNPIRYKFYRYNCGRDQRLKELWGSTAGH